MSKMSPIWAFRPNLHSDQNPNLERKRSHKHSPNMKWKRSMGPYQYIHHPIRHPLPQKREE
jgi:hypothetical protein